MAYQVNVRDSRDVRALRLLERARGWMQCHVTLSYGTKVKAYGIPSESEPNVYRLTNLRQCSCPDFQWRQGRQADGSYFMCAHMRAVRMYVDYVNEQKRLSALREQAAAAGIQRAS